MCAHISCEPCQELSGLWKPLKHPAFTVGWVAAICRSWLSPGKATQIFLVRNPIRTIQLLKKKVLVNVVFHYSPARPEHVHGPLSHSHPSHHLPAGASHGLPAFRRKRRGRGIRTTGQLAASLMVRNVLEQGYWKKAKGGASIQEVSCFMVCGKTV